MRGGRGGVFGLALKWNGGASTTCKELCIKLCMNYVEQCMRWAYNRVSQVAVCLHFRS